MEPPASKTASLPRAAMALAVAHTRYWTSVAPLVRKELANWTRRARAIPDPILRAQALQKLHDAGAHAEVTATLATSVPRRHRPDVVRAIVALEVMYDYLDSIGEQAVSHPIRNGLQLFSALPAVFSNAARSVDYYRYHPQTRDGGYLHALVRTARSACRSLPSIGVVAPVAMRIATVCGEAQTRSHAVSAHGADQLRQWAETVRTPEARSLTWWEIAGGLAASVLAVHALVAAAGQARTSPSDATRIADGYLSICTLTTMLDSLLDRHIDEAAGAHSYITYYRHEAVAERLPALAHNALRWAERLPNAVHHQITVAGVAGFYLSSPTAQAPMIRPIAQAVAAELGPTIAPIITVFSLWRWATQQPSASVSKWQMEPTLMHGSLSLH